MPDDDQNDDKKGADDQNDDKKGADDQNDDKLGDAGVAALQEERAARKRAEREAKVAKAEAARLAAEGQSEQEKAIAKAKADGAAEALKQANARILKAEVKAAAAGKLNDPADAVRFLDLEDFTVGDDGEVDSRALGKAIDQLVKERPYLGGNGGGKRNTGSADGGARGTGTGKAPDMNAWLRGERVSL